jgi:hypothetical protein
MRGEKARIDFDLSPSAEKKITNYVWVSGRTGSNLARPLGRKEKKIESLKGFAVIHLIA